MECAAQYGGADWFWGIGSVSGIAHCAAGVWTRLVVSAWAARLDEVSDMCHHAMPELKRKPSEYVCGPPYYQSIQLHEGELLLRQALEAIGEDTLMFAADYPHSQNWFPKSVDAFLQWETISESPKCKLLWENPLKCYRRFSAKMAAV